MRLFLKFVGLSKFLRRDNRAKVVELGNLRKSIYERLDAILD